jgi:hypothetical protein
MRIENDRAKKLPESEYVTTMAKEGRIFLKRGMDCEGAIQYAKESIALGWDVEVIGPDGRIYFIGGPA